MGALFSVVGFAQLKLSDVDTGKIQQKSIVNFLESQKEKGIECFDQFQPSISASTNIAEFDSNCHRFRLKVSTDEAWNYYLNSHPSKVWNGRVVSCGFIFEKNQQKVVFDSDPYSGLQTGQLYFIEMRVFFQLVKFPVCMMITEVDAENRKITFSYVESSDSKGDQTIQLVDDGEGGTLILHSSHHLTSNPLRDKTLYPIYHKKAISEVHRNIKGIIRNHKK